MLVLLLLIVAQVINYLALAGLLRVLASVPGEGGERFSYRIEDQFLNFNG